MDQKREKTIRFDRMPKDRYSKTLVLVLKQKRVRKDSFCNSTWRKTDVGRKAYHRSGKTGKSIL